VCVEIKSKISNILDFWDFGFVQVNFEGAKFPSIERTDADPMYFVPKLESNLVFLLRGMYLFSVKNSKNTTFLLYPAISGIFPLVFLLSPYFLLFLLTKNSDLEKD